MATFARLHYENGNEVIVNLDQVAKMERHGDHTVLTFSDREMPSLLVKETIEGIQASVFRNK